MRSKAVLKSFHVAKLSPNTTGLTLIDVGAEALAFRGGVLPRKTLRHVAKELIRMPPQIQAAGSAPVRKEARAAPRPHGLATLPRCLPI